ncbi:hypothetical protein FBEOM_14439 [Fusarium beomiforme]|uniref:Uncharacterized protein n=1 Tax=Fusarium beomiforme TaxID=44412 RepID=A0A9P5A4X1_9HYPO|nr:hypothetical protein FBEOM_14439 [Fusarium beomiforme]
MTAFNTTPGDHNSESAGCSEYAIASSTRCTTNSASVVMAGRGPVDITDIAFKKQEMGVNDYLPVIWNFSPSGHTTVNTVLSDKYLYVGSMGSVYRLAKHKGDKQAEQPLKGYGVREVSLAISEDATLLYVATSGYLISLDPISLAIQWYRAVPDWNDKIRILLKKDRIYTGSGGTLHAWTLNGVIIKKQSITMGCADIRIDICPDAGILVAGTSGLISAFELPDLSSLRWSQRVPNEGGSETTAVACGDDVVYAADAGWIYQLDATDSGEILNKQDFTSSAGTAEVNLTLVKSLNRLYAGCNGYGICMEADTLKAIYITNLVSSGSSVTSVLAVGFTAIFGSKGRVFQLDANGDLVAANQLSGYGSGNVSLAFQAPYRLWACPAGYVVAMIMLELP